MADTSTLLRQALTTVLSEIIDGAAPDAGWLLNRGDPGLLRSLDLLTAEQASAVTVEGSPSIAAHVDHLRFGLSLLNRASEGENPFADANWGESWRRVRVSPEEWDALRQALRDEAGKWRDGFAAVLDAGEVGVTGAIASAAHLAYHLGAIRQMNRAMRGPAATDEGGGS